MYPASNEVLKLLSKNYRQTVDIQVNLLNGSVDNITEKDVMQGGLTIDRCSVSSNKIEMGSAIASELSLTLNNIDGKFDNVRFEGAELFVRLGVKKYDARKWENATTHYMPMGYFTVDEPSRPLATINLSALDRMVLFDKPVDWSLLQFPMTVRELLIQSCRICNVELGNDITNRPNYDYVIPQSPEEDTTYRQIIQWIAELTATCGFMDWEGKLRLQWYEPTTAKITPSNRYSSDMLENDITITGVQVVDIDSNVYSSGNDSYAFTIEGNALLQSDYQQVANSIYSAVGGFTYRPYQCSTQPMPYLFPMDIVEYVDKNKVSHDTIVTNVTFTINSETTIEGKGETATNNGYATANPLTNRERIIINRLKREQNKTLNDRVQSVLELNELISNSLGLYNTSFENEDGSVEYYMHDRPNIEDSNTIYTLNAGGYAYTNSGWNNGNPVWEYGETKDGNAIFNKVCAYGLEVSNPITGYQTTINPEKFEILRNLQKILALGTNGVDIYNGALTVYKGDNSYSTPVIKLDSNGDLALSGYLTQNGSTHKALVGTNSQGYGGFYLYNTCTPYKRSDGTYKPYLEVWTSTDNETYIEGTNVLLLGVSIIANESEGNYARVKIVPDGGYLYGAWDFGQEQHFSVNLGANCFKLWDDDTHIGSIYTSTGKNMCLFSNNGKNILFGVNGNTAIEASSSGGTLWGNWGIDRINVRSNLTFKVDVTDVGFINWANDSDLYFGTNGSIPFVIGVGGNYRLKATSGGGILYGDWDFGQEQKFTHTINVPAFICRKNGTGAKVMSMYISTTDNPCFNSDNGKDFYFCVGGTTRLGVTTSGAFVDGKFQVNTKSKYVSLVTDETGNGGGHLWGSCLRYSDYIGPKQEKQY